ncbi:MAG: hypothetical protein ACK4MF_03035 [Hyphomicrobiaceae bacterium]
MQVDSGRRGVACRRRRVADREGLSQLALRFQRDEQGAVAVVLGVMFTVILFMAAIAIDGSRFTSEWMRDRQALDAAVLAASDAIGMPDQDAEARARGEAFYLANRPAGKSEDLVTIEIRPEAGEVFGRTRFDMLATLLRPFGYEQVRLGGTATAVRGGTAEVALVLDNSGSMAGTYIADLKTAAENLVEVVFAGTEQGDSNMSVAVVPFAGSVNVGSGNANAEWMDRDGISPLDKENTKEERSRFELFSDLNESWSGCVEVRKPPYDTTDGVADASVPASLFTPQFAPDEPDTVNAEGKSYENNYLVDDGGNCPRQECKCTDFNSSGKCKTNGWKLTAIAASEAQARSCKYTGAQAGYPAPRPDKCSTPALSGGPNRYCTTAPLLPLSTSRGEIVNAIRAMGANGMTNIAEGIAWGWRALSPAQPFAEGRSYNDRDNKKILIVMTDGENTYTSVNNHNASRYNALGFAKPYRTPTAGRLGKTYTSSAYTTTMNARTRTVCANAKAEGLKIYTIAFRLENDATTRNLLRECASDAASAYVASNGAALIDVFQNIGREISKLRISS